MKLLCEVPLGEVKSFQESHFKWLANSSVSDNLLFTFEKGKRMRVLIVTNTNGQVAKGGRNVQVHEVHSASLSEPKKCTSCSWNRDESLLALVVDRRQIFFWEVRRNTFVQFKPSHMILESQYTANDETLLNANRRSASRYIDHIVWSKSSNRLAICFANAEVLLCNVESDSNGSYYSEDRLENAQRLLTQIRSIYVSEHADLFVCSGAKNELLAMTFNGSQRLFCESQTDANKPNNIKFSPLIRDYDARSNSYYEKRLWLAYQSGDSNKLVLRNVSLPDGPNPLAQDIGPTELSISLQDSRFNEENSAQVSNVIVDFYWLSSTRLIVALASGSIHLVSIKEALAHSAAATISNSIYADRASPIFARPHEQGAELSGDLRMAPIISAELLHLGSAELEGSSLEAINERETIRTFEMVQKSRRAEDLDWKRSFAFVAATSHRFHYYEIYETREYSIEANKCFSFEAFDEVDLSEGLSKAKLELSRFRWSGDCSMLAAQLSNGHLLIYQTQLQHERMVVSHEAKTAYLSNPNELTLLNYESDPSVRLPAGSLQSGQDGRQNSATSSQALSPSGNNAIILSIPFKPSVLAIGPKHVAVAFNNSARFYTIESVHRLNIQTAEGQRDSSRDKQTEFAEQEYVTLVADIKLSSRFVATMLDDGRVKLHKIPRIERTEQTLTSGDSKSIDSNDESASGMIDNERFFPDPGQAPQRISAFTLTEELLIYSTDRLIHTFALAPWRATQSYDYFRLSKRPFLRLRPNQYGNKFLCLVTAAHSPPASSQGGAPKADPEEAEVYLYDLFSNALLALDSKQSQLVDGLPNRLAHQLIARHPAEFDESKAINLLHTKRSGPELRDIRDVIWDTDGRSVLLIQSRFVHVFALLEHTLEHNETLAIYADSAPKPASYSTLYASEGIVSYQTSLGRVMNSILETHNEELKLSRLELEISAINRMFELEEGQSGQSTLAQLNGHFSVIWLKLAYVRSILGLYSLLKCRDICENLMNDEAFKFRHAAPFDWSHELDQLVWRLLAAWAIYTQHLNYALEIYQEHGLDHEAKLLEELFEEMHAGLNSKAVITKRLFGLLESS